MLPGSALQGGTTPYLQGSSPQLQASSSSGQQLQPAPLNSTIYLQPTTAPSTGQTLTRSGGGSAPNPGATNTGGASAGPSAAQQQAAAAAAAQAAAIARARANYNNGLAADMSVINQGISTGGGDYSDFIKSAYSGANGFGDRQALLNSSAVQNELSKDQGLQGVRDMVSNGIQGGGVVLDNDNAGTSSAADALARAYGIQGRQQASKVGNQYVQGQNTIQTNQGILGNDENYFNSSAAPAHKADIINNIVSGANQTLTYLNAIAQGSGVTDLPAIQQQIDQVKADATAKLSAFDGEIRNQLAANAPTSQDANQAKAQGLFTAGTAPAQPFDFTNVAPAQLQNTGPSASSLPIFISSSNNKNNLPVTA